MPGEQRKHREGWCSYPNMARLQLSYRARGMLTLHTHIYAERTDTVAHVKTFAGADLRVRRDHSCDSEPLQLPVQGVLQGVGLYQQPS